MIVVVGGGITGLLVARGLAEKGADVQVLESAAQPGGVIRSGRVEGHLLDWGPQRTRLTSALAALIHAVGLDDELLTAPPGLELFVWREGRLRSVPFSVGAMARSDLLSRWGKLRLLLEPFTAGADPEESVRDYLTRKLGREAYLHLAGPLYGGLYASDPADMIMGLSLSEVLGHFGVGRSLLAPLLRRGGSIEPPLACSFREGMQALPHAIARELGPRLRLETSARALRRDGHRRWVVETDRASIEAEQVVVTVPAPAAARLLETEAPDAARRAAQLRYNPLAVVHLHARTRLRGLGFQVSLAEDLPLRGVTFNDSLFGRAGVYTAYLGGARHAGLVARDDVALGVQAVEQFRITTGHDARPLAVERETMPAWDRTWAALEGLTLPPGLHLATNWTGRPGLPGRLAAAAGLVDRLTRDAAARSVITTPNATA